MDIRGYAHFYKSWPQSEGRAPTLKISTWKEARALTSLLRGGDSLLRVGRQSTSRGRESTSRGRVFLGGRACEWIFSTKTWKFLALINVLGFLVMRFTLFYSYTYLYYTFNTLFIFTLFFYFCITYVYFYIIYLPETKAKCYNELFLSTCKTFVIFNLTRFN